jgi:hypothetical protein
MILHLKPIITFHHRGVPIRLLNPLEALWILPVEYADKQVRIKYPKVEG